MDADRFYDAVADVEERTLSGAFNVSRATIRRWKERQNAPHPLLRPLVHKFLGK